VSVYGPRGRGYPLVRIIVYLVAVGIAAVIGGILLGLIFSPAGDTPASPSDETRGVSSYGGISSLTLLLLTAAFSPLILLITHVFLRKWDRCSWRMVFGGGGLRELGAGYLQGWLLLGVMVMILFAAGWVRWEGWGALATARGMGTVLLLAVAFLVQGGTEEVVFRGYLFRNLGLWRALPAAVIVSSVLFGLVHGINPGAGWLPLANVSAIGVLLCLIRIRFSLWAAVGLHGVWNFTLAMIRLPVSGMELDGVITLQLTGPRLWTGGVFGPEASLLTTLLILTACGLLLTDRRTRAEVRRFSRREPAEAESPGTVPDPGPST